MPDNIYQPIPTIDRKVGKFAFNAMLNAMEDSGIYLPKGLSPFRGKFNMEWKDFRKAIIDHHPQIEDKFYTGLGLKLQCLDSSIAEAVLLHFTNQGIACLPIHDSFIVSKEHGEELKTVMKDKSIEVAGVDIPISNAWDMDKLL